jgi:hypothetical protein
MAEDSQGSQIWFSPGGRQQESKPTMQPARRGPKNRADPESWAAVPTAVASQVFDATLT